MQNRGGRPPCNVSRRIRDEGKSGFPYGLVGDMVVKYSNNNIDELKGIGCAEGLKFCPINMNIIGAKPSVL
jgi:hypothetical protein